MLVMSARIIPPGRWSVKAELGSQPVIRRAASASGSDASGRWAAGGVSPCCGPDPRSPARPAPPRTEAATHRDGPGWIRGGACPDRAHPVKAKLTSRIFHLPGMTHYERTHPDRCYASAARRGGRRAPPRQALICLRARRRMSTPSDRADARLCTSAGTATSVASTISAASALGWIGRRPCRRC